jgi:hypothetical protein
MRNFFLNYVFAPFVLTLGLIGNPIGLIVVGRKKIEKIGPVLIYKFLFIFDTIYLSIFYFYFNLCFFISNYNCNLFLSSNSVCVFILWLQL